MCAVGFTGYEVADMLVGRTSFTAISADFYGGVVQPAEVFNYETGFYAQDDWRVTRKLTVNYGLRYEVFANPIEKNDQLANFNPATGTLIVAGKGNDTLVELDKNNVAPRFGLAYSFNSKTVLRGGYGIFYSLDRGGIANQLTQNPPFNTTQFRFGSAATMCVSAKRSRCLR